MLTLAGHPTICSVQLVLGGARLLAAAIVSISALTLLLTAPHSSAASPPVAASQPNGKVLVTVPREKTLAVARLRRNGKLDRRFGRRGYASTGLSPAAFASALLVQPTGQINLAAQTKGRSQFEQYVVQLTKRGALDSEFGTGGISQPLEGRRVVDLGGLALGTDGSVLVGAGANTPGCAQPLGSDCEYLQLVARLTADGRLDQAFGKAGVASIPVGATQVELAVAADGRIVAAGHHFGVPTVARLTPNGTLDPTFGEGAGYVRPPAPVSGAAVGTDGTIYAGGFKPGMLGATALSSDGSIAETFASAGSFTRTVGSPTGGSGSIVTDSRGGIVLAGPVASRCNNQRPVPHARAARCRLSAGVLRLDANGRPVGRFGSKGLTRVPISRSRARFDPADGVQTVITPSGLRVAAPIYGSARDNSAKGVAVAALRGNGGLDRGYGDRGVARLVVR